MTFLLWLGYAFGWVLLAVTAIDVVGTLIVPRSITSRISWTAFRVQRAVFAIPAHFIKRYETLDAVEAWSGPATLLLRLIGWVSMLTSAFAFMLLPSVHGNFDHAYSEAGSSLFTLGYAAPSTGGSTVIDYAAAYTGLLVIAMQIGYLPTLYSAFNRRETEVTVLVSRAGVPAWGAELLLRTKFGIPEEGDVGPLLTDLFRQWERWSAEVAESHTTYPTLVWLRSPRPYKHWLISQLAVLDAAALHLSLSPNTEPRLAARLCLRAGFDMLRDVATAMKLDVDRDPDPDAGVQISYDEFKAAVDHLVEVGYPCEVSAEEAWPHFRGWRVNYESVAYSIAYAINAPAAKWSGPRRWTSEEIAPFRPANRQSRKAEPRSYA